MLLGLIGRSTIWASMLYEKNNLIPENVWEVRSGFIVQLFPPGMAAQYDGAFSSID